MLVSLCSVQISLTAVFLFESLDGLELNGMTRRLSKTRTLDGGTAINDGGFSWADAEIALEVPVSAVSDQMSLHDMISINAQCTLSTSIGFFRCVVSSISDHRLTLYITSKEA